MDRLSRALLEVCVYELCAIVGDMRPTQPRRSRVQHMRTKRNDRRVSISWLLLKTIDQHVSDKLVRVSMDTVNYILACLMKNRYLEYVIAC